MLVMYFVLIIHTLQKYKNLLLFVIFVIAEENMYYPRDDQNSENRYSMLPIQSVYAFSLTLIDGGDNA